MEVKPTSLQAGRVIIAGGAWPKELGAQLNMQVPVHAQRRQIVHLDLPGINTKPWPIVTAFRDHYMVPWPDAHVAVGSTRERRVGFVPKMTVGGVMELLDEALRVTPGLGTASIREVHVGLRPLAGGGVPSWGESPRVETFTSRPDTARAGSKQACTANES